MRLDEKVKFLVVGLGNPDQEYAQTLHNVGYNTVDRVAKNQGITWKKYKAIQGETAKFAADQGEVFLLKPLTYMNKSGLAVRSALKFWKVEMGHLLIVQDDSDLAMGNLKIGFDQSSGGHKGLNSIIQALGGQKFARIKIGVRPNELSQGGKHHVKAEKFILLAYPQELLENIAQTGAEAVSCWLENGLAKTMNKYNSRAINTVCKQ